MLHFDSEALLFERYFFFNFSEKLFEPLDVFLACELLGVPLDLTELLVLELSHIVSGHV